MMNPRRSRSLSYHPSSHSHPIHHHHHHHHHHPQRLANPSWYSFLLHSQPHSIQSLDLPISPPFSLLSLYSFLIDHLRQVEDRLRSIDPSQQHPHHHLHLHPSNLSSSPSPLTKEHQPQSDSSASDDRHLPTLAQTTQTTPATPKTITTTTAAISASPASPQNQASSPSSLSAFIQHVTHYVNQLKSDLFSTDRLDLNPQSQTSTIPTSYSSICSSLPDLNLKHPLDRLTTYLTSIPDLNQLIHLLTIHSQKLDELLSQLSFLSQSPTRVTILPFLPPVSFPEPVSALNHHHHRSSSPPDQTTYDDDRFKSLRTPTSLRQYFSDESDRLSSLLPSIISTGLTESLAQSSNQITSAFRACKEEAQAVLHDGEVFIREEGEKLKGWVDSETEKLRLALQMGASRLLTYHELPDEWKNNQFILRGYRFIPLDRWHHLLLSGIQWHNETINIHTHFFGTLSLFYLLFFLWPKTPHTALDSSTLTDRVISLFFLVCAIKCLICSTAWHLFAGCGTLGPFRRLACVDYVGISGLIAASVMSMEYYGFYCRPGLAAIYMSFTVIMGIVGMILPFKPFFDRPESKGIRIVFFVSMAGSALIPQAHMAYLYGLRETFNFYYPAYYSVISYLAGLIFYATNWPERIKPGWVFDTLFHSHQFWHVAIVVAIWLHWRAIGIIHDEGRTKFSCSVTPTTNPMIDHSALINVDNSTAIIYHPLLVFLLDRLSTLSHSLSSWYTIHLIVSSSFSSFFDFLFKTFSSLVA